MPTRATSALQSGRTPGSQPNLQKDDTTMRFMMMVKAGKDYEEGKPPSPALMEAVGKHAETMKQAGVLLETGGLLPSRMGARIRVGKGKMMVTDGPFAETKEVIGGFAILEASSKEEAIELARQFMQIHVDVMGPGYESELEIRQMFDPGQACG
jgi:hypothetical protein